MPRENKKRFQPFGDMLKFLNNLASFIDSALEEGNEISRTGEIKNLLGVKGLKAKYRYSVRVGVSENPFKTEMKNYHFGREALGIQGQEKINLLVDVFDEKGDIKVLVWLPGIRSEDIRLDVIEETLILNVKFCDRWHCEEIELPERVRLEDTTAIYHEGILEVTLKKSGESIKTQRMMKGGE